MKVSTSKYLFLDDDRYPPSDGRAWIIVRSSSEAIRWCEENGSPDFISFDHDLGGDDKSMIFVHWLVERDLDERGLFIPRDFSFTVHSANPIGAANIRGLLTGYLNNREKPVEDSYRSSL